MDLARADAQAARSHLAAQGWIARKAESFRHLPPPAEPLWVPEDEPQVFDEAVALSDGWTVNVIARTADSDVEARWFDAADPARPAAAGGVARTRLPPPAGRRAAAAGAGGGDGRGAGGGGGGAVNAEFGFRNAD